MADYQEGRIKFTFDESLPLIRAEDCSFYRKTFQTFCGGCKEMDFIFYHPEEKCLWFLEVKDYRTKTRTKSIELVDEIAQKTRDSLAFLLAGKNNSNEAPEAKEVKWFMQKAGDYTKIRIALHLEDSPTSSNLFSPTKRKSDLAQKLRQQLRAVDTKPLLTSTASSQGLAWSSQWIGS